MYHTSCHPVASWVGKVWGEVEVPIFRQTAANFRQRRLWVLKISILPLNSPKMGDLQSQILYFTKTIFQQAKIGGGGALALVVWTSVLFCVACRWE